MADIFISYARAEREDAERIARRLEALGLSVFLDVDGLDGGDVFSEKLDREVKTSGVVLGLWSPLALSRPWVQTECDIGKRRGVLVPAAIKPFRDMEVPAPFWNIQFVDLTDLSDSAEDPNWRNLMRSISRTLNRPDLAPPKLQAPPPPPMEGFAKLPAAPKPSEPQPAPEPRTPYVSPRPDALPRADAAVFYVLVRTAMSHETMPIPNLLSEAQRLTRSRDKLDAAWLAPAFNRILRVMLSVQRETGQRIPPIATLAVDPKTHLPPPSIDNAARAFIMDAYAPEDAAERIAELQSDRVRAVARLQTSVFAFKDWVALLPYVGLSPSDPEAYLRGDAGPGPVAAKKASAPGARRPPAALIASLVLVAATLAGGAGLWFADPFDWRERESAAAPPGPSPGLPPDAALMPPSPAKGGLDPNQSAVNPSQLPAGVVDPGQFPMLPAPEKDAVSAAPVLVGGQDIPAVLERTLLGHSDGVFGVAFSPDGSRVVTASNDRTARIWDARTGKTLATLSGHSSGVVSVAFSPDGSRIVTASYDSTARIWDAVIGRFIAVLSGHSLSVKGAAFSPDGSRVVTASWDNTGRIWDVGTEKTITELAGHSSDVVSAAFSPDGSRAVTASADQTAVVWDAATGQAIIALKGHSSDVVDAAFSPDGSRIVTASWDETARIWNAATGKSIASLDHSENVYSAAFSPDGSRIVTASGEAAYVWDAASGKPIVTLSGHSDDVRRAAFSPDGRRVVTVSDDKTAKIWRIEE